MSQESEVAIALRNSWDMIRHGNYEDAISTLNDIINEVPNYVDAYYGLGLARRNLGQEAQAIEAFQRALEISQELLSEIRSQYGGDDTTSSLETTEDDRYMMLQRMIGQRLNELGA